MLYTTRKQKTRSASEELILAVLAFFMLPIFGMLLGQAISWFF